MGDISLADANFLIFVLPGFVMVWTFRYFTRSKKTGDFELLGLSFIWGLISLIFFEGFIHFLCWRHWSCPSGSAVEEIGKSLVNPYAAAAFLSLINLMFGYIGSSIVKEPHIKKWLRKIHTYLRDYNVDNF